MRRVQDQEARLLAVRSGEREEVASIGTIAIRAVSHSCPLRIVAKLEVLAQEWPRELDLKRSEERRCLRCWREIPA